MKTNKAKRVLTNLIGSLIVPITIYVLFAILTKGRFGNWNSMLSLFRLSAIPILLAFGMGMNMMMGMWDFSIGAIIFAADIIGGNIAQMLGFGTVGLILCVFGIGFLLCAFNGFLYKIMKVPSLVLTVGMAMLYESLPRVIGFNGVRIGIKEGIMANMPWIFIEVIIATAIFYIMFNKLPIGHKVKALGANQVVASKAGIDISNVKFFAFVCGGVFIGLSSVLYLSNSKVVNLVGTLASIGVLFNAMMGIFIAFFLNKYCDFTFGIIIGTLSMQMLTTGLVAMGMSGTVQNIASGLFLLILLIVSSNQGVIAQKRLEKQFAAAANAEYEAKKENSVHKKK